MTSFLNGCLKISLRVILATALSYTGISLFIGSNLYSLTHYLQTRSSYDDSTLRDVKVDVTDSEEITTKHLSDDQGIIKLRYNPTSVDDSDTFKRGSNFFSYPNPFSARVNFHIGNDEYMSFHIYNIRGQKVADLSDQVRDFTDNQVVLNNLSTGIYFARAVNSNNDVRVSKFLYISEPGRSDKALSSNNASPVLYFNRSGDDDNILYNDEEDIIWSYEITDYTPFLEAAHGDFKFTDLDTTVIHIDQVGYTDLLFQYLNDSPIEDTLFVRVGEKDFQTSNGLISGIRHKYGYYKVKVKNLYLEMGNSSKIRVNQDSVSFNSRINRRAGLPPRVDKRVLQGEKAEYEISDYISNEKAEVDSLIISGRELPEGVDISIRGTGFTIEVPNDYHGEIQRVVRTYETATGSVDSLVVNTVFRRLDKQTLLFYDQIINQPVVMDSIRITCPDDDVSIMNTDENGIIKIETPADTNEGEWSYNSRETRDYYQEHSMFRVTDNDTLRIALRPKGYVNFNLLNPNGTVVSDSLDMSLNNEEFRSAGEIRDRVMPVGYHRVNIDDNFIAFVGADSVYANRFTEQDTTDIRVNIRFGLPVHINGNADEDNPIELNLGNLITNPNANVDSVNVALQDGFSFERGEGLRVNIEPPLDYNGNIRKTVYLIDTHTGAVDSLRAELTWNPMTDFRGYMRDLVSDSTVVGSFKIHLGQQQYILVETDSTGYFDVQFPPQETIDLEVIENDTHYGTKYNNTPALDDVINMHITYIPKPATLGQPAITDDLFRQFLYDLTDRGPAHGQGMKGRIIEHIIIDLNSAQQLFPHGGYTTFTPAFQQQIVDLVNEVVLPRIPGQAPVVTALEEDEEIPVGDQEFLENHVYIFPDPANNSINHWYIRNESRIKNSRINLRPAITGGTYEELLSIFGYFPIWNPIYHGQTRFHETGSAAEETSIDKIATKLTPTIKFCNENPNQSPIRDYLEDRKRVYFGRGLILMMK